MKFFRLCLLVPMILIVAGCASPLPLTAEPARSTPTESPTEVVMITSTSLPPMPTAVEPSATFTATATLLPSPMIAPTPTPLADFSSLGVITLESNTFGWMIQFHLPGIEQPLLLKLDGKDYRCSLDERYSER
jgi:hypothetical protein